MANYGSWDKDVPLGTAQARDFPELYRSDKSVIEAAFEDEHYFKDGSENSAGMHKPGSARPYFGASSALSTIANIPDWRLFWSTSENKLYALSSSSIVAVGAAANEASSIIAMRMLS